MLTRTSRQVLSPLYIILFTLALTLALGTVLALPITPSRPEPKGGPGPASDFSLGAVPRLAYGLLGVSSVAESSTAGKARLLEPLIEDQRASAPGNRVESEILGLRVTWPQVAGSYLLAAVVSSVLGLYLFVVRPASLTSYRRFILLGLVIVGTVLIAKITLPGRPLWAVAFPLAAGSMLLTTLLELSLGLISTVFISLMVTYVADISPDFLVYLPSQPLDSVEKFVFYLVTGTSAALGVRRARRTSRYFMSGLGASFLGSLVVLTFWTLSFEHDWSILGWRLVAAMGGGLVAAALAVGLFVVLGLIFEVTTSVQLHELAQTDHPLLHRLLQEAPGTYYHSILVGNLAEQACEAIGADALLARIGAYYHDIGKIQNPGFFVENQRRGENVHDRLHPQTSANIIIAHVTDGLRLAQAYRLPLRIQGFIREHHGTRLATAFYNAATHLNPQVDPELFRYPGPTPRSKETAVVMLADSAEATARSAGEPSPEELDALIERVVQERVKEGQMNNCDLTFRDLETIKTVFKSALRGILHPRVQYPAPATESLPHAPAEDTTSPLSPGDAKQEEVEHEQSQASRPG